MYPLTQEGIRIRKDSDEWERKLESLTGAE